MTTSFQQRRDTAANWTSNDTVLLAGEWGLETDTNKAKFGDGTTAWTSLGYSAMAGVDTSGTPVDNDFAKFTDADTIEGRSYAETLSDLSGEATSAFDINGQDITNGGVIFLTEQADAEADVEGKGQVWVNTATPNELWFTNDAGTDAQLGVAGGAHAILDGSTHNDSVADAVTRGSIIIGNATPKWDELVVGTNGQVLTTDGTDISWGAAGTGDVSKVGTPANDQVGVWTGDGTIEGDGDLTFAGQTLTVGTVDTDEGILVLNADADAGGKIQLHVEGDSDATIASFDIAPVDDDLHIGPSTDTDMLKFNDSTSIQATKPFIGTEIDATSDFTVDGLVLTADTVTNDAALTITTGAGDILLTPAAAGDVNIPVNIGLEFAGAEKIESDGTDLNITVGATGDINIGADIGLTFGDDGEKIEGNGTDLTIAGNNINLTAAADVIVPVNIGVKFGDGGEHIETDNTDFTITSGGELNLTAASDVVIPVNIGLHLGDGAEKIESNNTDLTINSGVDINLTATDDVNIPSAVGVTFGNDGEKIEGDGTDMTIASSGILNISATNHVLLAEDTCIQLDTVLSADAHFSGIIEYGTAGATLAIGDIVYLQTADTRWELAGSDDGATGHNFKLGMCVKTAASDGDATLILLYGKIRSATLPALTVGAPVYLGTTLGDVQVAAPSGSTDIVRIVGYGNTAEDLFFCPENDWITLA